MNKANVLISLVAALAIGFAVGYVVGGSGKAAKTGAPQGAAVVTAEDAEKYPSEAKGLVGAPVHGAKAAKVTMVEVSDFQCPFCKRGAETVDQLMEKYGEDLSVTFVHLPLGFHKRADPAARAAQAANLQGKFWEYQKLLWANNKDLEDENLESYAKEVGLDVEKWKKDKESKEVKEFVEKNAALANTLGLSGTPGFFINGEQLKGAQPIEKFSEVIDRQKAQAEQLIAAGVPVEKIHAALSKNAMEGKYFSYIIEGKTPSKAAAQAQAPKDDLEKKAYDIEIGLSPRQGEGNEIIITEFSDFQCPHCSRVVGLLDEVMEHYGEKRVSIVFKQFPLSFHKEAQLAAEASLAAHSQGKFWELYRKMFENQRSLSRPDLERYASEIGLDMTQFKKDLDEGTWKGQITDDMQMARRVGVQGTPSIFINGRRYNGGRTKDEMVKIIDQKLLAK